MATPANSLTESTGPNVGTRYRTLELERMSNEELLRLGIATHTPPAPAPEPTPAEEAEAALWAPMNADVPGTLYVVRALPSTPAKIGFTRVQQLEHRLSGLQTGNPYPLVVVAQATCLPAQEREVHKLLSAERLTGEWFDWTPRVQALVSALANGIDAALQELSA